MPVPWNPGSYFKTGDEVLYNPNGKIYVANVKSIGQVPSIVPPYNNTYWNLYIPPGIITIISANANIIVANTTGPTTTLQLSFYPIVKSLEVNGDNGAISLNVFNKPTGGIPPPFTDTWSNTTNYVIDDEVLYLGVLYKCILEPNINITPPNPTYWEVVIIPFVGLESDERLSFSSKAGGDIFFSSSNDLNFISTNNTAVVAKNNFIIGAINDLYAVATAGVVNFQSLSSSMFFQAGTSVRFIAYNGDIQLDAGSAGNIILNAVGNAIQLNGEVTNANCIMYYSPDFYNSVNNSGIGNGFLVDGTATASFIPSAAASMPQQIQNTPPISSPPFTIGATSSYVILDISAYLVLDDISIQRLKISFTGSFNSTMPSIVLWGKIEFFCNGQIYYFLIHSDPASGYVPSRLASTGLSSVSMIDYVDLGIGGIPFNVATANAGSNKVFYTINITAYNAGISSDISNVKMAYDIEPVFLQQAY